MQTILPHPIADAHYRLQIELLFASKKPPDSPCWCRRVEATITGTTGSSSIVETPIARIIDRTAIPHAQHNNLSVNELGEEAKHLYISSLVYEDVIQGTFMLSHDNKIAEEYRGQSSGRGIAPCIESKIPR
jgi:hypothetical protein